jgi:methionyl aminopeptidase
MITKKSTAEIEIMAEGGKILAGIMDELEKSVRPGITTKELDRLAESLIFKFGGKCSFKGYKVLDNSSTIRPYPSCLCTSINEEIVHAIPSERKLENGDIISLDIGMFYKGFHSDMAKTFPVGKISEGAEKLIEVTKKALELGIEQAKPGNKISDISRAIQKHVEGQKLNVVKELCGHGIGREIHEDPEIINYLPKANNYSAKPNDYVDNDQAQKIEEGMVLCLEPMVVMGDWHIKKAADRFGWKSADNSLVAHFEHTIAVTKNGHKILTI